MSEFKIENMWNDVQMFFPFRVGAKKLKKFYG